MMRVRLTQIDGALPNVALMVLSAWHKSRGDEVVFTRKLEPDLFERSTHYDIVYGSAIFTFSNEATKKKPSRVQRLRNAYPDAIIGGTGVEDWGLKEGWQTLADVGVPEGFDDQDYEIVPDLRRFSRWAIQGYYRLIDFKDYDETFKATAADQLKLELGEQHYA